MRTEFGESSVGLTILFCVFFCCTLNTGRTPSTNVRRVDPASCWLFIAFLDNGTMVQSDDVIDENDFDLFETTYTSFCFALPVYVAEMRA